MCFSRGCRCFFEITRLLGFRTWRGTKAMATGSGLRRRWHWKVVLLFHHCYFFTLWSTPRRVWLMTSRLLTVVRLIFIRVRDSSMACLMFTKRPSSLMVLLGCAADLVSHVSDTSSSVDSPLDCMMFWSLCLIAEADPKYVKSLALLLAFSCLMNLLICSLLGWHEVFKQQNSRGLSRAVCLANFNISRIWLFNHRFATAVPKLSH